MGYLVIAALIGGFFYAFVPVADVLGRRGPALPTLGALLVGAAAWFGLAFAGALNELRCDEGCDERSGTWWHSIDAWQWTAQVVLALVGFGCVVAAIYFTTERRYRRAVSVGAIGFVLYGGWFGMLLEASG